MGGQTVCGDIETDCHDNWETLDWNNPDIKEVYASEESNIKIRTGKKDGVAYVYFSSNALYKKDDRVDFVSKIIENNRFEWENITLDVDHEKVIYIRDVWLS